MITVQDIMTREVITVTPDMEIVAAAKVLMDNHINGAPVVNEDRQVIGILCRDDLISQQKELPLPSFFVVLDGIIPLSSSKHIEKEMEKIAATTVRHAMTADPTTVTEDTPIEVIASLMVDKKIHTIPVLDKDDVLVGVIGKEDILRTLIPK
ncbi:MAG TPA: CBS domain-containing protein [Deltaproteobacteria bacterium]|nr:CBS domain-containing protein [Deltaproteobacteria bacterium]